MNLLYKAENIYPNIKLAINWREDVSNSTQVNSLPTNMAEIIAVMMIKSGVIMRLNIYRQKKLACITSTYSRFKISPIL